MSDIKKKYPSMSSDKKKKGSKENLIFVLVNSNLNPFSETKTSYIR